MPRSGPGILPPGCWNAVRFGLLPAGSLGERWVASVAIHAGDAITRSEVIDPAAAGRGLGSMSIPVPQSHAEGGAIVAGDTVDVIAQSGSAQPADPAGIQYIAQGLKVLTVANTRTGGVLATSPDVHRGGRRQGHRVPVGLRAGCRRRGLVSWHPGGPHHRRNVRTLT